MTISWNGSEHAAYPHKASILITDGGDPTTAEDFPMARWYLDGSLNLDSMITRRIGIATWTKRSGRCWRAR